LLLITKESDGEPVLLTVLRGGKEKTVKVTPQEPPEATGTLDFERIQLNISELHGIDAKIREKLKDAGVDLRMQLIEPGRYLPHGVNFLFGDRTEMPDDLSITIHKQGKQPADIEVKQGEETWNVKENDGTSRKTIWRRCLTRCANTSRAFWAVARWRSTWSVRTRSALGSATRVRHTRRKGRVRREWIIGKRSLNVRSTR